MNMVQVPILEISQMPKGRKRTALHNEILHHINLGETSLTRFLRGYLTAALWSSTGDNGDPLDNNYSIPDIAVASLTSAWAECSRFQRECATNLIHLNDDYNGHNFWLTRNHHGSGFWDEVVESETAELDMLQLTRASEGFGEVDLYVGDDKKLHFSNERSIS